MNGEQLHCVDSNLRNNPCKGEVELRTPISGTGVAFARCDHHWEMRLDEQERINKDYPDSPCPPDWFDPTYAGERWDEE